MDKFNGASSSSLSSTNSDQSDTEAPSSSSNECSSEISYKNRAQPQTEYSKNSVNDYFSESSSQISDQSEAGTPDSSAYENSSEMSSQVGNQSDIENHIYSANHHKGDDLLVQEKGPIVTSVIKPSVRTAREMVRNQERLVTMLQNMKSDIMKMEREAQYIREDVIRSRQFVRVVIERQDVHHLPPSGDGYNMAYSVPRVSYPMNREFDTKLNMRYLNQISTGQPTRGSFNVPRRRSRPSDPGLFRRASISRAGRRPYSDDCSGNDSEYEPSLSRAWSRESLGSSSVMSEESVNTAGNSTDGTQNSRRRRWRSGDVESTRRSSYLVTGLRNIQTAEPSDDIDL